MPGAGTAAMIPFNPFTAMSGKLTFAGGGGGGSGGAGGGRTIMPAGSPAGGVQPAGFLPKSVKRMMGLGGGHHRRQNVLNPKALRRALRRARGFEHFAASVLKIVKPGAHVHGFKPGFGSRKKKKRSVAM